MSNNNRDWTNGRFSYAPLKRTSRPTDKEIIDAVVDALGEARLWIIADAGEDDIIVRKIDTALALARGESGGE